MCVTQATVWAPDCGKVKLRSAPSQDCSIYWNIPSGAEVDVIELGTEWAKVSVGNYIGYMRQKYLMFGDVMFNTTEDADIVVDRKRLEDIYEQLGDILGVRG